MATGDFKRNIIGSGTFGDVYKAELDHFDSTNFLSLEEKSIGERPKKRSIVAIKHIKIREDQQGEQGFLAEIEMLSNCKHPNIVSLLGFCKEDSHMILVYEYASNGSLHDYMGSTGKYLTWLQRIKICIEIARGLKYLHTKIEDERRIIHRDIKSDNILLGENFEAKIADFGLSKFRPESQMVNTIDTMTYAGTNFYIDPEYSEGGKFSNKVDIYSFGVVLFEMLSGRLANDLVYVNENGNGIASVARRRFKDRTIKEMVDPRLWEETDENNFSQTRGPNQYALHAFLEIAHQCVATQAERPTTDIIVKKLEETLLFQEGNLKHLQIPLTDILLATENFAKTYLVRSPYGEVYKAELDHFDSKSFLSFQKKCKGELPKKRNIVAIKRIFPREDEKVFHAKVEMLNSHKHPNIVSLLGFCEEDGHMIIVYEHASNGSLNDYLGSNRNSTNLSWVQRIKICIDVAHGVNYLHSKVDEELGMKHFDIKSSNILLGENWEAKIACIELSKIHPQDQNELAGIQVHLNSQYDHTGKLKNDTYTYSFGVVLLEILSGRFASDPVYTKENSNGIVPIACRHFNERTMKKMVDRTLMEETNVHTLKKGPVEDSLDALLEVAYQCVTQHPSAEVIIQKLQEALYFQENTKDHLKISLVDIELATQNLSDNNLIAKGAFANIYKGEVTHAANGQNTWAVKRLHRNSYKEENEFKNELRTLLEYRHENIIGIVGYCFEQDENIIVYEYASRGSLDKHLDNNDLTWMNRLKICIDIARVLDFLHGGGVTQEVVIHRDLNSHSILLNDDWKAKASNFRLSLIITRPDKDKDKDLFFVKPSRTEGYRAYIEPQYFKSGHLTKEVDIYSFGVVLSEILSGKLQTRTRLFKLDNIVFEGIKEQIATISLTTFLKVTYQCLHNKREERPTTGELLQRLKQALEFQEDHEIWEPKLPKDYKEIIDRSNSPGIYSTEKKKDLYDMLSKGILLDQGKLLFLLGNNGEKNEMISATTLSYKHRWSRKWQSPPESRFNKVARMLDVSNLQIQVNIKQPQLLSPGVDYGVHLVFRFCGPRKSVAKRMYVNLKYKKGSETLHSYFATRREDGWMVIQLCRFLNHGEDTDFKFLLESFSRCYCASHDIYVEGIEFQAIDNVKPDEIKESKEVNKVKHYTLSAKEAFYESSDVKLFNLISSTQSRFQVVIELQRQQVFRIKCKIKSKRLSPDTNYACYLVFKLSENCCGLHCPVIVRDLLQCKNKEKGIIYFRSPSPCNVNDTDRVPKEREDGWMEVNVWQFNSNNQLRNGCVSVSLKLISYEGTMSGLIVSSVEFWPM